jgi:hypothetical protein
MSSRQHLMELLDDEDEGTVTIQNFRTDLFNDTP